MLRERKGNTENRSADNEKNVKPAELVDVIKENSVLANPGEDAIEAHGAISNLRPVGALLAQKEVKRRQFSYAHPPMQAQTCVEIKDAAKRPDRCHTGGVMKRRKQLSNNRSRYPVAGGQAPSFSCSQESSYEDSLESSSLFLSYERSSSFTGSRNSSTPGEVFGSTGSGFSSFSRTAFFSPSSVNGEPSASSTSYAANAIRRVSPKRSLSRSHYAEGKRCQHWKTRSKLPKCPQLSGSLHRSGSSTSAGSSFLDISRSLVTASSLSSPVTQRRLQCKEGGGTPPASPLTDCLPFEIFIHVCSFLMEKDYLTLLEVNRGFAHATIRADGFVWRALCLSHWQYKQGFQKFVIRLKHLEKVAAINELEIISLQQHMMMAAEHGCYHVCDLHRPISHSLVVPQAEADEKKKAQQQRPGIVMDIATMDNDRCYSNSVAMVSAVVATCNNATFQRHCRKDAFRRKQQRKRRKHAKNTKSNLKESIEGVASVSAVSLDAGRGGAQGEYVNEAKCKNCSTINIPYFHTGNDDGGIVRKSVFSEIHGANSLEGTPRRHHSVPLYGASRKRVRILQHHKVAERAQNNTASASANNPAHTISIAHRHGHKHRYRSRSRSRQRNRSSHRAKPRRGRKGNFRGRKRRSIRRRYKNKHLGCHRARRAVTKKASKNARKKRRRHRSKQRRHFFQGQDNATVRHGIGRGHRNVGNGSHSLDPTPTYAAIRNTTPAFSAAGHHASPPITCSTALTLQSLKPTGNKSTKRPRTLREEAAAPQRAHAVDGPSKLYWWELTPAERQRVLCVQQQQQQQHRNEDFYDESLGSERGSSFSDADREQALRASFDLADRRPGSFASTSAMGFSVSSKDSQRGCLSNLSHTHKGRRSGWTFEGDVHAKTGIRQLNACREASQFRKEGAHSPGTRPSEESVSAAIVTLCALAPLSRPKFHSHYSSCTTMRMSDSTGENSAGNVCLSGRISSSSIEHNKGIFMERSTAPFQSNEGVCGISHRTNGGGASWSGSQKAGNAKTRLATRTRKKAHVPYREIQDEAASQGRLVSKSSSGKRSATQLSVSLCSAASPPHRSRSPWRGAPVLGPSGARSRRRPRRPLARTTPPTIVDTTSRTVGDRSNSYRNLGGAMLLTRSKSVLIHALTKHIYLSRAGQQPSQGRCGAADAGISHDERIVGNDLCCGSDKGGNTMKALGLHAPPTLGTKVLEPTPSLPLSTVAQPLLLAQPSVLGSVGTTGPLQLLPLPLPSEALAGDIATKGTLHRCGILSTANEAEAGVKELEKDDDVDRVFPISWKFAFYMSRREARRCTITLQDLVKGTWMVCFRKSGQTHPARFLSDRRLLVYPALFGPSSNPPAPCHIRDDSTVSNSEDLFGPPLSFHVLQSGAQLAVNNFDPLTVFRRSYLTSAAATASPLCNVQEHGQLHGQAQDLGARASPAEARGSSGIEPQCCANTQARSAAEAFASEPQATLRRIRQEASRIRKKYEESAHRRCIPTHFSTQAAPSPTPQVEAAWLSVFEVINSIREQGIRQKHCKEFCDSKEHYQGDDAMRFCSSQNAHSISGLHAKVKDATREAIIHTAQTLEEYETEQAELQQWEVGGVGDINDDWGWLISNVHVKIFSLDMHLPFYVESLERIADLEML